MSVVSILSGGDEPTPLAFAELVDHGSGKTALGAAPWIRITNISPIGQPVPLRLVGTRYHLHIQDIGLTFVECMAKALTDPVTFLATDIVDKKGNSVIE